MQLQGLSTPTQPHLYQVASGNLFETQHVGAKESQDHMYGLEAGYKHDVEGPSSARRPLAHFDHSTHDILQAQLGECMPDHDDKADDGDDDDDDEQRLKAALAAASAMSDLGNPHTALTAHHHHYHHHPSCSQPEASQDALTASASLWEDVSLPQGSHFQPSSTSSSFPTFSSHQNPDANANTSANANTFAVNHLATPDLHGSGHHEYDAATAAAAATTSSPEIRRLLEMDNQAFLGEESQLRQ
jgi:hypothetical protein